jgi:hypothetical protein
MALRAQMVRNGLGFLYAGGLDPGGLNFAASSSLVKSMRSLLSFGMLLDLICCLVLNRNFIEVVINSLAKRQVYIFPTPFYK